MSPGVRASRVRVEGGWVPGWRWGDGGEGGRAGVRRSQDDDEKARRPAARPVATITAWIGL